MLRTQLEELHSQYVKEFEKTEKAMLRIKPSDEAYAQVRGKWLALDVVVDELKNILTADDRLIPLEGLVWSVIVNVDARVETMRNYQKRHADKVQKPQAIIDTYNEVTQKLRSFVPFFEEQEEL